MDNTKFEKIKTWRLSILTLDQVLGNANFDPGRQSCVSRSLNVFLFPNFEKGPFCGVKWYPNKINKWLPFPKQVEVLILTSYKYNQLLKACGKNFRVQNDMYNAHDRQIPCWYCKHEVHINFHITTLNIIFFLVGPKNELASRSPKCGVVDEEIMDGMPPWKFCSGFFTTTMDVYCLFSPINHISITQTKSLFFF